MKRGRYTARVVQTADRDVDESGDVLGSEADWRAAVRAEAPTRARRRREVFRRAVEERDLRFLEHGPCDRGCGVGAAAHRAMTQSRQHRAARDSIADRTTLAAAFEGFVRHGVLL